MDRALPASALAGLLAAAFASAGENVTSTVRRFEELQVGSASVPVRDLTLSCGHLTLALKSGHVASLRAGDQIVGVFFEGAGAMVYRSEDPVEFPVATFEARKATRLAPEMADKALVFRDTFVHREVGEETFLTFLTSYQKSFRWKFGATKHVAGLLQFLTKKDFTPFFEQYYWGTGMPPER